MVEFHKLCRLAQSSRTHKTESVSVMGHAWLAAVSSIVSGQKQQNSFAHILSFTIKCYSFIIVFPAASMLLLQLNGSH